MSDSVDDAVVMVQHQLIVGYNDRRAISDKLGIAVQSLLFVYSCI